MTSEATDSLTTTVTAGLNVTATVGGIAILALAVVSIVSLRHVGAIGGDVQERTAGKGEPCSPVS